MLERSRATLLLTPLQFLNQELRRIRSSFSVLSAIRKLGFARYLEEATFDNDFISIGSFSLSMPPRQCVSESSIVGIDWPASSRGDAQLP
jgi:hypothetical protein